MAADDDHEWEPFALATLLHVGFSSSKPVGYDATKTVWTYYSYFYPRGRPIKDSVCVAQAGDMLAAPLSLFGELERWGRELLPGGGLPSCFFVDDLFFAAYAAYHRSTVYTHPWRRWLFREARRPRPCLAFSLASMASTPRRRRRAIVGGSTRLTASFNAVEAAAADGRARVQALRAGRLLAEDDAAALPRRPRDGRGPRAALAELPERARGARLVDARRRREPVRARGFCERLVLVGNLCNT